MVRATFGSVAAQCEAASTNVMHAMPLAWSRMRAADKPHRGGAAGLGRSTRLHALACSEWGRGGLWLRAPPTLSSHPRMASGDRVLKMRLKCTGDWGARRYSEVEPARPDKTTRGLREVHGNPSSVASWVCERGQFLAWTSKCLGMPASESHFISRMGELSGPSPMRVTLSCRYPSKIGAGRNGSESRNC
jgi:hypothetical protein